MAYQAKRKASYQEEFQLVEADGTVVHTLHVALDADSVVRRLGEKHLALVHALHSVQSIQKDNSPEELTKGLDVLGGAVVDLLEAVFGEADTKTIVDFYDNRYVEMCQEVVPFITEVVIPQVRKISQENKKSVLHQYNRKARRSFGKK